MYHIGPMSSDSEEESEATPPPSPVKPKRKNGKKHLKKKRKQQESSIEESSEEDDANVQARARDYNQLAKAAFDSNMARYKTDVLYRNLFPYL